MTGPASWRRYADRPLKLGEPPAFETALETVLDSRGVEHPWHCEACWPLDQRIEPDPKFPDWRRNAEPPAGARIATLCVAGKNLCAECALTSWEG